MATHSRGLKSSGRFTLLAVLLFAGRAGELRIACADDAFAHCDLSMFERPFLPRPKRLNVFPDGMKELWLQALRRPDAELQRMVVDSLATAQRKGIPIRDTNK